MTTYAHLLRAIQVALHRIAYWMEDGLDLARALKLAVVGPRAGCAASLHLPMAARIVEAMRLRSATRKFAQVSACWFWRAQMSIKLNAELRKR